MKRLAYVLKLTGQSWLSHNADRMGAALAFYTLLSLAPLVMLSLALIGLLLGEGSATQPHLIQQVRQYAGNQVATFVEATSTLARQPTTGAVATLLGLLTLLVGASGVFVELRSALNTMWDIDPRGTQGIFGLIKDRLLSIGMVLAIGFLLVVSLGVSAVLAAAGKFFGGLLPIPLPLLEVLNFVTSFCGIAIMFALVLRYVPDERLPWRDVWVGGALSALLFNLGKLLIGLYLGRAAVGSLYGASGSTVAVTIWVYYSAQLFLFAAEFTRVYGQQAER